MKGFWYSIKIVRIGIVCLKRIEGFYVKLMTRAICIITGGFSDSTMLCVQMTLNVPMPRRGHRFAVRAIPNLSGHI